MSHHQEVRALMRPPIWSALPLLGSGTNNRMRVPAVMPRTGDTWWGTRQKCYIGTIGRHDTHGSLFTESSTTVFAKMPDVLCAAENISSLDLVCHCVCLCAFCLLVHEHTGLQKGTQAPRAGKSSRVAVCYSALLRRSLHRLYEEIVFVHMCVSERKRQGRMCGRRNIRAIQTTCKRKEKKKQFSTVRGNIPSRTCGPFICKSYKRDGGTVKNTVCVLMRVCACILVCEKEQFNIIMT